MKVCHMTSVHTAEDVRIFQKECVSLAYNGYDVYEVAPSQSSYVKKGVNIVGVGKQPSSRIKRMLFFSRRVCKKALSLDCDVYHFHDPELLPYGLKLKRKGKKVIFDSHENTVEQIKEKTWIKPFIRGIVCSVFDNYQKYVCKRLDAIISVTPHICEYFEKINPNTYMITNYPILMPLQESNEKSKNTLCFAGGISEQWNHDKIIKAIGAIPQCKYILCGRGEEEYIEKLKKMESWNQVDYKGVLSHDTVNAVLSKSTIGVAVLSYNHNTAFKMGTLGNTKIFEEMMAGLPVVCTDFDLWKEIVDKYQCGISVNPENASEIAEAIQYLLDNPNEAQSMGRNGYEAIKNKYNWSGEEARLLKVYREL